MRKKSAAYIELDEIRTLLRKTLDIKLNRTGVYFYIKTHNFPLPVGLGRPRKWERKAVEDWVRAHKDKFSL
jgi:predicted DNA-binding transcriptional regulator AlpA